MAQLFSKLIMKTSHGRSDADGRAAFGAVIYRNFALKSVGKMKRLARLIEHGGCTLASRTAGLEWTSNTGHWSVVTQWAAVTLRETRLIGGCYT